MTNPCETNDRYYLTLKETFHPDNASVSRDRCSSESDRWGTVWAEAHLVSGGVEGDGGSSRQRDDTENTEPTIQATAVLIDEETTLSTNVQHQQQSTTTSNAPSAAAVTAALDAKEAAPSLYPCEGGGFLGILIGTSLTISAVAYVFAIDLSAVIVYVLACGFFHLCKSLENIARPVYWLGIYHVFLLQVYILLFVDSLLLSVSVLVSELLGGLALLLCSLFGCSWAIGKAWHQYIRRLCHLTRWAFRGFHQGWMPERLSLFHHRLDTTQQQQQQQQNVVSSPQGGPGSTGCTTARGVVTE